MGYKLQHWVVVVGPRETVKCNPGAGEFGFHISQIALHAGMGNGDVRIFVKADDKEILLGTLSDDKCPHYRTDLSFEEDFELLHTSETRNISIIGSRYRKLRRKSLSISGSSTEEDHKSKDTESGSEKFTAPNPTATQSSTLEKKKDPEKLQTNVGCSEDDVKNEDYVDSEEGKSKDNKDSSNEDDDKSSDEDDDKNIQKHAKYRDRFVSKNKFRNSLGKMLLKPPGKKAKMTTPSKSNNTVSGTGTRSGHAHVATPYPSKNVNNIPSLLKKNTPSTGDRPKQPAGSYACTSCSRTFHSYIALKTHCKVKKHKRSPH